MPRNFTNIKQRPMTGHPKNDKNLVSQQHRIKMGTLKPISSKDRIQKSPNGSSGQVSMRIKKPKLTQNESGTHIQFNLVPDHQPDESFQLKKNTPNF